MEKQDKSISEEAFARMAHLCSQKEYCRFDISQKLYKLKLSSHEIENIVDRLTADNFISEERYVRSYIGDKLKFNKWGKKKIELSLRQKQIPQEKIFKVLNEFTDSELNQLLESVLEKKWRSVKGKTESEKKNKLIRYALGRGFEMRDIISCMNLINLGIIDEE